MLEKILERINDHGWNVYSFPSAGKSTDVLKRGQVYYLRPNVDEVASDWLTFDNLERIGLSPTISIGHIDIPYGFFTVADDIHIQSGVGLLIVDYGSFFKSLESLPDFTQQRVLAKLKGPNDLPQCKGAEYWLDHFLEMEVVRREVGVCMLKATDHIGGVEHYSILFSIDLIHAPANKLDFFSSYILLSGQSMMPILVMGCLSAQRANIQFYLRKEEATAEYLDELFGTFKRRVGEVQVHSASYSN